MSDADRLDVLTSAWMIAAEDARREALAFPDGFPNEHERQVGVLDAMAEQVRKAQEGHRLRLEDSLDLFAHVWRQRDAMRVKIRQRDEALRLADEQAQALETDGDLTPATRSRRRRAR